MEQTFTFATTLPVSQRSALEHLLYFNVNQERVRLGIKKSIDSYGVPEIAESDGTLSVRVGSVREVQTLFAISQFGHPLGVVVFARMTPTRTVVLHVGVLPRLRSKPDVNAQVLLELIHQVHCLAGDRERGERVEIVYSQRGQSEQRTPSAGE